MRTALITGASRGLGRGIAETFASKGYNLAIGFLERADLAQEAVEVFRSKYGIEAVALQGNVSRFEDCRRIMLGAAGYLGNIEVLVNNAAQYSRNPSEEERARLALTKLNAVEFLSQLAGDNGVESVVNISSMCTVNNRYAPFITAYQAGVESLTQHFAKKFRGKMRVNAIRPGACRTDMVLGNYSPEEINRFVEETPDKMLIEPSEIGDLVFYLATNPLLTGQIITADKGATLHGN